MRLEGGAVRFVPVCASFAVSSLWLVNPLSCSSPSLWGRAQREAWFASLSPTSGCAPSPWPSPARGEGDAKPPFLPSLKETKLPRCPLPLKEGEGRGFTNQRDLTAKGHASSVKPWIKRVSEVGCQGPRIRKRAYRSEGGFGTR